MDRNPSLDLVTPETVQGQTQACSGLPQLSSEVDATATQTGSRVAPRPARETKLRQTKLEEDFSMNSYVGICGLSSQKLIKEKTLVLKNCEVNALQSPRNCVRRAKTLFHAARRERLCLHCSGKTGTMKDPRHEEVLAAADSLKG